LRLGALITFITVIWLMVLAVAAFLVTFVPSVQFLFKEGERSDKLIMSSIQAVIAMGVLLLFIMGLSRLKGFYAARKLHL
jgi:TRAP-type mannitol/chloroaromatic compound transport system permease small subunit